MRLILLLISLSILSSCATYEKEDRLMAENKAGRNRIGLLDRENHVLKKENADLQQNVRDRDARIDKLSSDLASLQQQYKLDLSLLNTQIELQRKRQEASDKAYEEKIRSLSEQNVDLDKKLADTTRLADQMKKKADDISLQNKRIIADNAKREADMTLDVSALKETVAARDKEIIDHILETEKLESEITTLKSEIDTLKTPPKPQVEPAVKNPPAQ
jgi:chromosome segregation ATPase